MSKKSKARSLKKIKARTFYDWEGHRYFEDGAICPMKNGVVTGRYAKGSLEWVEARKKLTDAVIAAREAQKAKEAATVRELLSNGDKVYDSVKADLNMQAIVNQHTPEQQLAINTQRKAFQELAAKVSAQVKASIGETPSTDAPPADR